MTDIKSKGEAVSTATAKDAASLMEAIAKEDAAGDVQGKLTLGALSQTTVDELSQELRDALAQIDSGFGDLTAPGTIAAMNQAFNVIDAFTVPDYEDRSTGEIKTKHVFRLQFTDGVIRTVMQSDARPRKILARAFTLARQMGGRLEVGPYMFKSKPIPGRPQAAWILEQQSGFSQRAYAV